MYQSQSTPEMVSLAELIHQMVRGLHQVVPVIDRPKQIQNRLRAIEAVQREGREKYQQAVSRLFPRQQADR